MHEGECMGDWCILIAFQLTFKFLSFPSISRSLFYNLFHLYQSSFRLLSRLTNSPSPSSSAESILGPEEGKRRRKDMMKRKR